MAEAEDQPEIEENNDDEEQPEQEAEEEEPAQEEPEEEPEEEPAQPPPAPKEEEKEEPKPKKKKKSNGKYTVESAWKEISKNRKPKINWYACKLKDQKSKKNNGAIVLDRTGDGGLSELKEYLADQNDFIVILLLRVDSNDQSNSSRAKFIYMRFLGKNLNAMTKARMNPQKQKIESNFPVRHMSIEVDSSLVNLDVAKLSKEFLRIGGAHKPDSYSYGPDQIYKCK